MELMNHKISDQEEFFLLVWECGFELTSWFSHPDGKNTDLGVRRLEFRAQIHSLFVK